MSSPLGSTAFRPRPTRCLAVWRHSGIQLKVYTIVAERSELAPGVLEASRTRVVELASFEELNQSTPYGFVIVHQGVEAVWLLVDFWDGDILRHFLLRAPLEAPKQLSRAGRDGTMACVWELDVIRHERDAWVRHVLTNPTDRRFDEYLLDRFYVAPA